MTFDSHAAKPSPEADGPRRRSSIARRIGIGARHGERAAARGSYPCETVDDKASGATRADVARQIDVMLVDEVKTPPAGMHAAEAPLEQRIEKALAGERCPGCGRHCELVSPSCGKGRKIRATRLAQAGIVE